MRYSIEDIVWQEVPGEVSLAYTINGCNLRCPGCHSADTWANTAGQLLTTEHLQQKINQYQGLITCLVFLGGEWEATRLKGFLSLAQNAGLKTCLYTGLDMHELDPSLLPYLTYLKTGRWKRELGGLASPITNQRFYHLASNTCLNHLFLPKACLKAS